MVFPNAPLRLSNPGGYNRLEKERTASEGGPYTNCKPAFLTPAFTTTSIAIVGAPTFLSLHAIGTSQERTASEGGPYTNCRLSAVNFAPPTADGRRWRNLSWSALHSLRLVRSRETTRSEALRSASALLYPGW